VTTALSDPLPRPSPDRLAADLRALEALTRPDRPYTRRAFSDEDRAARQWLAGRMAEARLVPAVDAAGNQIGRRAGRDAAGALMVGSHLDTVEAGGRFDGIAGVLAGLEAARCLDAGGHRLRHALEVVNFTCEEASDFGLSTIGSRAMSGKLDEKLRRDLARGPLAELDGRSALRAEGPGWRMAWKDASARPSRVASAGSISTRAHCR